MPAGGIAQALCAPAPVWRQWGASIQVLCRCCPLLKEKGKGMELKTANVQRVSKSNVMGHTATIKQSLKYIERFERWAKEKAARNLPVGRPGLSFDCPICHYVWDVTGWQIFLGIDTNCTGIWWLPQDIEHIAPLPPAFEQIRKCIDRHITISAEQLVVLISEWQQKAIT
jgi:hypothetical protein